MKDGAVVASFAADADLGRASALARGDVDRADAERFADPKAAQEQQCDERPFGDLRPVLSGCEERVRLVAVKAEVRVLVLDGRPAHAAQRGAVDEVVLLGELVERGDDREAPSARRRRERRLEAGKPLVDPITQARR